MSVGRRFESRIKNIDEAIDMLVSAQKENGVTPTMKEALFDPITKERINKFKRKRLEKEGVDLSSYETSSCSGNCSKCKPKSSISNIERGIFVYSEDDLVDESDAPYVCEYCTKISYDGKYKPEVCDTCDDCEGCTDYMSGSCDGCSYSNMYNNGMSYGEMTNQDMTSRLSSEDSLLIDEITDDVPDYKVHYPVGKFTILNY